ncbi:hypothetical protein niasHT_028083 [Heterodera trifolii]|uniref:Uncharacterized protein n=1 Tax=Heterodera trifolii TaxID=157864 RepID=A0ABD2KEG7_9BILA
MGKELEQAKEGQKQKRGTKMEEVAECHADNETEATKGPTEYLEERERRKGKRREGELRPKQQQKKNEEADEEANAMASGG